MTVLSTGLVRDFSAYVGLMHPTSERTCQGVKTTGLEFRRLTSGLKFAGLGFSTLILLRLVGLRLRCPRLSWSATIGNLSDPTPDKEPVIPVTASGNQVRLVKATPLASYFQNVQPCSVWG